MSEHIVYDEDQQPTEASSRNPRHQFPNHRERGPKVCCRVTYRAIGELVNRSPRTIRNLATGRRRRFDPTDLGSVVEFIGTRLRQAPA